MSKKRSPITTRLCNQGKTISQWSEENGFKVRNVQAVIYGHNKGLRGQAMRISEALGLKMVQK